MAENTTQAPKILELSKGDYIFQEGNEAGYAYVLAEGTVEIVRNSTDGDQVLGKVEKGSFLVKWQSLTIHLEVHLLVP